MTYVSSSLLLTVRNTLQILKSVLNKEEIYRIIQIKSEYNFFMPSFAPSRYNTRWIWLSNNIHIKLVRMYTSTFFLGKGGEECYRKEGEWNKQGRKIPNIKFMIKVASDKTKSQKLVSNQISECYLHAGQNCLWHPYFNTWAF